MVVWLQYIIIKINVMLFLKIFGSAAILVISQIWYFKLEPGPFHPSDVGFLSIALLLSHLFFQIMLRCMVVPSPYWNSLSFGWRLTESLTSTECCLY